jgi:hypothetical protein
MELRSLLQDLADKLHLPGGDDTTANTDRAEALRGEVDKAIETDDHEGLSDRLEEDAVAFESDHPSLAQTIRSVIDALSAGGL